MDGSVAERLRKLEMELEALQRIKTQEDYDEGARLHTLHNSPWVKGMYSHLQFEPYKHQEFPKAIYRQGFTEAYQARVEADMIPAYGTNDIERKQAVLFADRRLLEVTKKVDSEQELRKWLLTGEWFESPEDVIQHAKGLQRDIETAAAHRAYEDRNMGERAAAERDRFDEEADHFVAEIPEQRRPAGTRTVKREAAFKGAANGSEGTKEGKSAGRGAGRSGAGTTRR